MRQPAARRSPGLPTRRTPHATSANSAVYDISTATTPPTASAVHALPLAGASRTRHASHTTSSATSASELYGFTWLLYAMSVVESAARTVAAAAAGSPTILRPTYQMANG